MSFAGLSTPIFAVLFGWLFLDETTPWQFWCSLSIVFFSLYIFHKEEVQPGFIYTEEHKESA
jgi:drug/metabolite transporter (DMT)-like permease